MAEVDQQLVLDVDAFAQVYSEHWDQFLKVHTKAAPEYALGLPLWSALFAPGVRSHIDPLHQPVKRRQRRFSHHEFDFSAFFFPRMVQAGIIELGHSP